MLKPAILSVSLLTIMASAAVSPALAKISQAFPGVPQTAIKLILTLPSLAIIPFSLASGWLTARLKKRSILLVGLLLYTFGGVGGAFARNITELLLSRCILGAGIGLLMPLSTTLISDFFDGPARTRMMGLSGALTNVGGVIFLSASGWLACFSWRLSFAVYSLALVTLVLVARWLPEPPSAASRVKAHRVRLSPGVFYYAALGMLMMIAFYAVPTNLALFIEQERQLFSTDRPLFAGREDLLRYVQEGGVSDILRTAFSEKGIQLSDRVFLRVEEEGRRWVVHDGARSYPVEREGNALFVHRERLGRPALAGYALALMTFSGALSGGLLGMLLRRLRRYAGAVAIALMGIGFGLLAVASSFSMVCLALPFIGFAAGIMMPLLLLHAPRFVPAESQTFAIAVVGSAIYFGQFISPLVLKGMSSLTGNDGFRFRFGLLAAGLAAGALLAFSRGILTRARPSTASGNCRTGMAATEL